MKAGSQSRIVVGGGLQMTGISASIENLSNRA